MRDPNFIPNTALCVDAEHNFVETSSNFNQVIDALRSEAR